MLQLAPEFSRRARSLSKRWSIVEPDDASQLALLALHWVASRHPLLDLPSLERLAWVRARGSILDAVRAQNGGRRHGASRGYGFPRDLVLAARATGDLPHPVFIEGPSSSTQVDLVSPAPPPDELLIARQQRASRVAAFRSRLRRFSPRDRALICLVLSGIPQRDVAALFGISFPRVSQVLHRFVQSPSPRIK